MASGDAHSLPLLSVPQNALLLATFYFRGCRSVLSKMSCFAVDCFRITNAKKILRLKKILFSEILISCAATPVFKEVE